jgi:hypothetical protein
MQRPSCAARVLSVGYEVASLIAALCVVTQLPATEILLILPILPGFHQG